MLKEPRPSEVRFKSPSEREVSCSEWLISDTLRTNLFTCRNV